MVQNDIEPTGKTTLLNPFSGSTLPIARSGLTGRSLNLGQSDPGVFRVHSIRLNTIYCPHLAY